MLSLVQRMVEHAKSRLPCYPFSWPGLRMGIGRGPEFSSRAGPTPVSLYTIAPNGCGVDTPVAVGYYLVHRIAPVLVPSSVSESCHDCPRGSETKEFCLNWPTYQRQLRSIGAFLDRTAADGISMLEVTDGFLVRSERFRHTHVDVSVTHVTRESLLQGTAQSSQSPGRAARRTTLWSGFSHTYEDFFRALGFELDDSDAGDIVVDETGSGLFLSYRRCSTGWIRQVILSKSDIEEILNEAVRRRRARGSRTVPPQAASQSPAHQQAHEQTSTEWMPVREDIPYQGVLRALGAFLDERGARSVSLLETPTGFAVRYELPSERTMTWRWLHVEELSSNRAGLRQKSTVWGDKRALTPGGYEDIFRALGYQLEAEHASGVLLDFQTEDLVITYSYLDPAQSFTRMKRYLKLTRGEQGQLLEEARGRRQAKPDLLARLRARRER